MNTSSPLPPGPTTPALLQTLQALGNPMRHYEKLHRTYGDVFTLRWLGFGAIVHLTQPADIKTLFTGDAETLLAGESNASLFGAIAGRGTVFTMDGAQHLRRRKLLLPPFHGERMQVYATIMREITDRVVDTWPARRAFPLHPEMQHIALQVILRAVFGLDEGARAERLARLLSRLATVGVGSALLLLPQLQWDLGRFSPWGRIVHLARETRRALDEEVALRRATPDAAARQDVLSLLLSIKDEEGRPLTDEELRDELIVMLLAGHETTGTSLAWIFERILGHPEVLAKLDAELDAVRGGAPLERAHVDKLVYLDAVIKEAMRTRPILPTVAARKLAAPFEVAGYTLPAGTFVTLVPWLVHHRPEIYPEPDRFLPERFLGKKADPYEWLPFGGGVRRCLGMAFALYEIKVVVASVLARVRLRLTAPPRVGRRGFFIAPDDGTRVEVLERPAAPAAARLAVGG